MLAPEAHMRKMNTVKRSFSSSETPIPFRIFKRGSSPSASVFLMRYLRSTRTLHASTHVQMTYFED